MKMPGNKLYRIVYSESVVKIDIPALPLTMKQRIKKAIEERLMHEPYLFGKPLQYAFKGQRRLRVGDYRILYGIYEEKQEVKIHAIQHRSVINDD